MGVVTGYTAGIVNENYKTLSDYILSCANAYIANNDVESLISKFDSEINNIKSELEKTQSEYNWFLQNKDNENYFIKDLIRQKELYHQWLNEAIKDRNLFNSMLDKVKEWKPSKDYKNIKTFATEQIEQCLEYNVIERYQSEISNINEKLQHVNLYIPELVEKRKKTSNVILNFIKIN